MHTYVLSHGLKTFWRSCPRRVNAGNKNTPSMHHPRRRNVTTSMVGLKDSHTHTHKISPKMVTLRDIAGDAEEEEEESYQWCEIGTLLATLSGAWRDRTSARTGWPCLHILWLDVASLICSFYLSVTACKIVWVSIREIRQHVAGMLSKQATNNRVVPFFHCSV